MGYHSINKAEIVREYNPQRRIVAKVYCDELAKWDEREFPWDGFAAAAAWVESRFNAKSM